MMDKVGILNQEGIVNIIRKKEIRDIRKDLGADIKSDGKSILPDAQPKERRKLTGDDFRKKDEIMAMYYKNLSISNDLNTAGGIVLIPGGILDVAGLFGLLFGYSGALDKKIAPKLYSAKEEYDTSLSETFISAGCICIGIGIPCSVIGAVMYKLGDNKRLESKLYRNQADDISFQFHPLINPLNGSYGLALSIHY